jgi:hypothetical protein
MARYSPFSVIPRWEHDKAIVYAVLLSNGIVKVGFSRNPRVRLGLLNNQCRHQFQAGIDRFHIGRRLCDGEARRVEHRLIERMTEVAKPVGTHREFFADASYEIAVSLVDELSA